MLDLEEKLLEFDERFSKTLNPWQKETYEKIVNLYIVSGYPALTAEGKKSLQEDIAALEKRFEEAEGHDVPQSPK
jgi:hypothetical protein